MAVFHWQTLNPSYLWYLVGLIASDGCLYNDGRHLNIVSAERDFLEEVKFLCLIPQRIGTKLSKDGRRAYQIQIGSVVFYRYLCSIGLMPNKSKILGPIAVPERYFCEFLRGVIDGDGCLRRWIHPTNHREQWSVRIYSAAHDFITWLQRKIEDQLGAYGKIFRGKSGCYALKFGKMAGIRIARKCYIETSSLLFLHRKYCLARALALSAPKWSRSKTVVSPGGETVNARDS